MEAITDSGFANPETLLSGGQVHVIRVGPVGLLLIALLQSMEEVSVRLYLIWRWCLCEIFIRPGAVEVCGNNIDDNCNG